MGETLDRKYGNPTTRKCVCNGPVSRQGGWLTPQHVIKKYRGESQRELKK